MTLPATAVIDSLRTSIERNTAALHNAKPVGIGRSTPAELLQARYFLLGMIHAYRVATDFNANDAFIMWGQVDLASKNAQQTFKTAKKVRSRSAG